MLWLYTKSPWDQKAPGRRGVGGGGEGHVAGVWHSQYHLGTGRWLSPTASQINDALMNSDRTQGWKAQALIFASACFKPVGGECIFRGVPVEGRWGPGVALCTQVWAKSPTVHSPHWLAVTNSDWLFDLWRHQTIHVRRRRALDIIIAVPNIIGRERGWGENTYGTQTCGIVKDNLTQFNLPGKVTGYCSLLFHMHPCGAVTTAVCGGTHYGYSEVNNDSDNKGKAGALQGFCYVGSP